MSVESGDSPELLAAAAPLPERRTRLQSAWRALKKAPITAWFGLIVVGTYVFVALFAPLIAPYGEAQVVGDQYMPWDNQYLLGTDQIGRDMLSRLIFGARNSIGIAVLTTALSFSIGGFLGMLAATLGGWIDQILARSVDILMAIPQLIFALVLLLIFGSSVLNLILIIAVLDSTRVFRLTRAVAMNVVVQDFVEAARLQGEKLGWITTREILPNILPPLIAEFGLRFCFVFLTIAALSFLGLGIQPPTADWGAMIADGQEFLTTHWMLATVPGLAVVLTGLGLSLLSDGLTDVLRPR